ncbi:hypothetical protein K8640_41470 [Myxococcus sp. XM-1-1-1]|uniref:hypothetical protein n=1 Tax=Myxococcus sp. XM-1-1-1 TaxID=2874602 RepID=UPI001CBE8E30|nr:hypothetical protein [Myxococcus sp. XM-1-1-1]MBZ4414705.1 hypothetical protein [Myxococcus sp. XM-1-1-1]
MRADSLSQKIDLAEVGMLGAGEYLVAGSAAVVGPLAGRPGVKTLQRGTSDFIQHGGNATSPSADAVALNRDAGRGQCHHCGPRAVMHVR